MNAQRMKTMLRRDLDILDRLDQELGRKDLPPLDQMLDELFYRRFLSSVLRDYSKCSKHILHLFFGELNRARGPETCEIDSLDVLVGAPPFALSETSLNFIQALGYFVRELEQGCHNINVSNMRDLLIRLPDFLSDIKGRVAVYLAESPE